MNFLQICQRVRQETGVGGSDPITTVGQSGMNGRIVNYVKQAWEELQVERSDWRFLWAQGSVTCVDGTRTYDPTATITTFDHLIGDMVTTVSPTDSNDIQAVTELRFQEFVEGYERGQTGTGRPLYYTAAPDRQIRLAPIPDAAYSLAFDYYRTPQELSDDTDIPLLPTQYHLAIVYRAVMLYAAYDEAVGLHADAALNYERWKRRIMATECPTVETAGVALDAY